MFRTIVFSFILLSSLSVFSQLNIKHFLGTGRYAIFKQEYTEAIDRFSKVIEVKPEYAEAYFLRGIAKYSLGDYLGAREDYTAAIRINPFYAQAYHYRGLTKEQLNDFNDALSDFEQSLQINPTESMVYIHRGLTYLMNDKYTEARNDFNEALRIDPNQPDAYMNRAITYLELADTAKAVADLNKSIRLNPFDAEAFRRRGLVSYFKKAYTQAIDDYNMALRLDPKNSLVIYQRALAQYKDGNYDEAIADYNAVITLDPENALALYNRALLKTEMGQHSEAIADYDMVSELNPDNVLVYYNRAGVKIEIGDYKGALKDYDKAIDIFPDFATAYINRSVVKNKLGQDKEAYFDRQRAETIITDYKKAHNDTTYQAFKDTSLNLSQLVDFNSEFNNDFSRSNLRNKNVQITLKNNYIIIPVDKSINPENVTFIAGLFDAGRHARTEWKWIPDLWKSDTLAFIVLPKAIDSLYSAASEFDTYSFAVYQSIKNNFYKALQSLDREESGWEAHFVSGTIKAQMEEYLQSMNDYPTEIRINSDGQPIGNTTPSANKTDFTNAIEDLSRSIELNNQFSLAYYNRGNLHCQQRDFKQGIEDYTQAIKIDELPEAYYNRGLTLIYLKETEKGCLDVSRAGELGLQESYNVIKRYCKE